MPPSLLDGRVPREHHEHQYDKAGRLVRTVVVREPAWTEQDQAEALAMALYRSWLCPGGCGQPIRESTSHYETGPAYEAHRIRCRACDARAVQIAVDADKKIEHPQALLYRVEKTEGD